MAVDLTSLEVGDKVMRKYGKTPRGPWQEVTVARVGRKYLYVEDSYGHEGSAAYSRVGGRDRYGAGRVTTPELLVQERHEAEAALNDMYS